MTVSQTYERTGKALGIELVDEPALAEASRLAARVAYWRDHNHQLHVGADWGDLVTILRQFEGECHNHHSAQLVAA